MDGCVFRYDVVGHGFLPDSHTLATFILPKDYSLESGCQDVTHQKQPPPEGAGAIGPEDTKDY